MSISKEIFPSMAVGTTLPTIHDKNNPICDPSNLEWESTEIDYIVNYENEYSQWRDRQ